VLALQVQLVLLVSKGLLVLLEIWVLREQLELALPENKAQLGLMVRLAPLEQQVLELMAQQERQELREQLALKEMLDNRHHFSTIKQKRRSQLATQPQRI
jgi:hypothetical protein